MIIIVQLVLVVYLLNITIGMWRYDNYILDIAKDMELNNSYYSNDGFELSDSGELQIGEIRKVFGQLGEMDQSNLEIMLYNDVIAENIRLPLSRGIWFDEYNGSEVPIIINYRYAKEYSIESNDMIDIRLEYTDSEILSDESVRCEVIGIMDKMGYYLSFSAAGNYLMWNNLLKQNESVAIIMSDEIQGQIQSGRMIFLEDLDNDSHQILDSLDDRTYITSVEQITENSKKVLYDKLETQIAMWFLVFALSLASLMSNNMMEKIFEEKEFTVYYMLGLDWKKCIAIEILRSVLQIVISFIIAFVLLGLTHGENNYKTIIIDQYNYLISIIAVAVVYIFSSFWTLRELYKTDPIELIRRNDQ
jgi:hypothetical protein